MTTKTGTYTGNGGSQSISLGFEPKLVLIATERSSGNPAQRALVWKLASQPGDDAFACGNGSDSLFDGVTLDSDGFDVGDDDRANRNGITYHYMAIGGADVKHGTYTGDGAWTRDISTGSRPKLAIVVSEDSLADQLWWLSTELSDDARCSGFAASASTYGNGAPIASLGADGFSLDDAGAPAFDLNENGKTFHWLTLEGADVEVGKVDAADTGGPHSVSLGYQPAFVLLLDSGDATSAHRMAAKGDSMAGDDAAGVFSGYIYDTKKCLSLDSDGFEIGADFDSNSQGHYWFAAK